VLVQGFPPFPKPKTFLLPHGGTVTVPGKPDTREIRARPVAAWPGAPLEPTGNPMLDGVGPSAYAERADEPDLMFDGTPALVPLRAATGFSLDPEDPDPRGMNVLGANGISAGTVSDVWVDRADVLIRYVEVKLSDAARVVLVPMTMVDRIDRQRGEIKVNAILARQFADAPALANPMQITKLEEDRICGYFAGGTLYATPDRTEPLL
jgi:photosynthetic reaction center H subunit